MNKFCSNFKLKLLKFDQMLIFSHHLSVEKSCDMFYELSIKCMPEYFSNMAINLIGIKFKFACKFICSKWRLRGTKKKER